MLTIVCFGDWWVNKVSVGFLQQLDLKNKTWVELYRFGINWLSKPIFSIYMNEICEKIYFYELKSVKATDPWQITV